MEYALRFKFKASNNEAEYEALLAGLRLAKHLGVKQFDIFSDSQLVVNQVTNNFDAKDSSMAVYLAQTQLLLKTTRSPKFLERQIVMQMLWIASPQQWKTRLGEKFRSNCWQHQAPWLRKCATYNRVIVGLPRFINSLLMAPFQMTKSKLSRFDTRLPIT
ncbi:hypothetical protein PS2_007479 [Malus domestica]